MKSTGHSTWKGTWKEGDGTISTDGDTLRNEPFSFASRFENAAGASPEELFAAALAGCFNQALANNFGMNGLAAESVDTSVTAESGLGPDGMPAMLAVSVSCTAKVPGCSTDIFHHCAEQARTRCAIAKVLKLDLSMTTTLLD
ncbi:hypothetical protein LTR56_016404 [Elasticomyces elasticus]|nr:hypothetical protein LTR56_016404 [Elasticomyces elasticus]KAK3636281.1 hypothetical protein LTR22_018801 [Elasticomyces elasticus]KAK4912052.1 hypothetical protein LTR49_019428 [Elasticomyces elasticus]KAK5751741.1 hypothetical protein LTS12_018155 [Elasticomyces elasticus]